MESYFANIIVGIFLRKQSALSISRTREMTHMDDKSIKNISAKELLNRMERFIWPQRKYYVLRH